MSSIEEFRPYPVGPAHWVVQSRTYARVGGWSPWTAVTRPMAEARARAESDTFNRASR